MQAAPAAVWRVLTAFGRCAVWHPTLSLDGAAPEMASGARLAVRLSGGSAGEQAFTAELTEVAPPRLLAWQGGLGVFFGRHTFELRAHCPGTAPGSPTRNAGQAAWLGP